MRRTYTLRMWWKCWGITKYNWQYDRLQESFIEIYSMKYREPFCRISTYVFREILTYVDLEECHDLKMDKELDEWWKELWWRDLHIPNWLWEREEMQRAFIEIYLVKYRAPFCRIPTSAFRKILTYCEIEKLVIS